MSKKIKTLFTVIFILFLVSCANLQLVSCNKRPSPFPIIPTEQDSGVVYNNPLKSYSAEYFVVQRSQCKVYTNLGQFITEFPHKLCHFTSDGYVGMASKHLYFYNQKMENLWKLTFDRLHHDLYVDEVRKEIAVVWSKFQKTGEELIEEQGVTVVDYNGKIVFEWNSFDHLKELEKIWGGEIELEESKEKLSLNGIVLTTKYFLKINAVQIIPKNKSMEKSAIFKPGNLLINFHNKPFVIIINRNNGVLWSYVFSKKPYMGSHGPRILENGDMIFFKNRLKPIVSDSDIDVLKKNRYAIESTSPSKFFFALHISGRSKPSLFRLSRSSVEIIDPVTKFLKWSYKTPLSSVSFFSPYLGHAERLENGNVLVTHVTHGGSAFEVTTKGEIVWEWVNEKKYPTGRPMEVARVIKIKKDIIQPFLYQTF